MKARYAVYPVSSVHRERDPVERPPAHEAGEAARVVGLAGGAEDALQDRVQALAALLQLGAEVVSAAVGLPPVHRVEGPPLKRAAAVVAGEAADVVALTHRLAPAALTHDPVK